MNCTNEPSIHDRKVSTLALYGLTPDSKVRCGFRNPDGTDGTFDIPAEYGFRCLSVCPGYWSNESMVNYAYGHGLVKPGASLWYVMKNGQHVAA